MSHETIFQGRLPRMTPHASQNGIMNSQCRKSRYRGLRFSKFPGGCSTDPLAAHAFGARFFTLNILTLRTPLDETQLRACSSRSN